MSCEMKMYWNWDTKIPYIFFSWWTATTPLGLGFAVIAVFFLAFFYETIVNLRARYDVYLIRKASTSPGNCDESVKQTVNTNTCCSSTPSECCNCSTPSKMCRPFSTAQCIIRSTLFAISNFYSLFLMMIFMTYNAYLCVALVLGAGTGHFWSSVFIPETDPMNRPRSCCN